MLEIGHKNMRKVGEASEKVCGIRKRDGLIRAKLISRKSIPKFETGSIVPTT